MGRVGEIHKEIGFAKRRRCLTVYIGGQQAAHALGLLEANGRGEISRQHICPVIGAGHRSGKAWRKDVKRSVVAVWPNAHLGIIWEGARGKSEGIAIVATRRVRCGRDGHAVQKWRRKDGLRCYPTPGRLVVLNDDVAVVVRFASPAKAFPESVSGRGAHHRRACRLVEHFKCRVDPFHKLRRSHRPVRIRGHEGTSAWHGVSGAQTVKVETHTDPHRRTRRYLSYRIWLRTGDRRSSPLR